jgi:hypothetical protein
MFLGGRRSILLTNGNLKSWPWLQSHKRRGLSSLTPDRQPTKNTATKRSLQNPERRSRSKNQARHSVKVTGRDDEAVARRIHRADRRRLRRTNLARWLLCMPIFRWWRQALFLVSHVVRRSSLDGWIACYAPPLLFSCLRSFYIVILFANLAAYCRCYEIT